MKLQRKRALRLLFGALAMGMSAAFFGFASLFFIRGRSLARGSAQFRSLFAAERAVQAAVWHLSGIMLSTVLYALLMRSGVALEASETWLIALWALLFLAPHALMQIGLWTFMRAVLIVAPQMFRPVRAFEVRRRVALT